MNRHAKASSAGSNLDQGSRPGSIRRAFATRGASSGDNGSGAPSKAKRNRLALLVLSLAALAALALVATAGATKYYDSTIGTSSGSLTATPPSPSGTAYGASFGTGNSGVGDVAVNDPATNDGSGTDGWIYVVDRGNNRIQAFDANKNFKWAIGRDVVASKGNEAQSVTVTANGGTFTLTFGANTTPAQAFNVTAANLQTALNGLASINTGGGSVTVAGGPGSATGAAPYVITFTGVPLAAANQPQITVDGSALTHSTGTPSAKAATTADGFTGGVGDTNEKQSATIGGSPSGGTFTLTFGANTTAGIPFNASAAEVKAALQAIASVGAGNVEVSGSAGGPYAIEFIGAKAAVDQTPMTANASGLTPSGTVTIATTQDGASFEKCVFANQCKVGTTTATATLGNAGTFNIAQGIDIDQATGNFFVNERTTNRRVQEFTASGAFIRAFGWDITASGPGDDLDTDGGGPDLANQFETCNAAAGDVCKASGAAGNAAGQFGSGTTSITGIAVAPPSAPNAGKVYVADPTNSRAQQFTVPGSPTGAVAAGTPFGIVTTNEITYNDPNTFTSTDPRHVAAGADGIVYLGNTTGAVGGQVARFDTTTQTFLPKIFGGSGDQFLGSGAINGLEVNPANGNLLVGRTPALGIMEVNVAGQPAEFDSSRLVDSHFAGTTLSGGNFLALGVNGTTGVYYVPTSGTLAGSGIGQRILTLDDTGVDPPPTVTLLPPTALGGTTATLNATVNPNGPTGFPTLYRFQVSKNGVDWTDVAANALVGATGDGSSPVSISDKVSGLDGNTFYRVRVLTTRAPGAGIAISTELAFITDRVKPEVTTLPVQGRSTTTATLVGSIRPNGLPADYYFEWGKTTAYERGRAPIPDGQVDGAASVRAVRQSIDGLFQASTFHYRLVASNAEGTTFGNDIAFDTRPTAAVGPSRSYEMVTPPFKATRSLVGAGSPPGFNANPGVPSLDGDAIGWSTFVFPLTDDVRAPFEGDQRISRRSAGGWVSNTLNTVAIPTTVLGRPTLVAWKNVASSGDLRSFTCCTTPAPFEVIPTKHSSPFQVARDYTIREGTGSAGYTAWLADLDTQLVGVGLLDNAEITPAEGGRGLFNDQGTAVARWGLSRGSAQVQPDPLHPEQMVINPSLPDPSLTQQYFGGNAGGRTAYIVRAGDPDDLPGAPRDLAAGCTGTVLGGDATLLPIRNSNGTGATSDDYLGTEGCGRADGVVPAATGSGDLSNGSNVVTNVSTASGTFAPGQIVSGRGIPLATKIASVGVGTLTLSAPAAPASAGTGTLTAGSNALTGITWGTGTVVPGQAIAGTGIPAGTTVSAVGSFDITLSQSATGAGAVSFTTNPPAAGAALSAEPKHITSARGAQMGNALGTVTTSMSNDGERSFFASPDPQSTAPGSCAEFDFTTFLTATGPLSDCPSQLYVRQYDTDGDPFVRWVSQPQGFGSGAPAAGTGTLTAGSNAVTALSTTTGTFALGTPIRGNGIPAGTTITATGAGTLTLSQNATASGALTLLSSGSPEINQLAIAGFQGASRDGRYVYFRTASPLLPSDPNNGTSSTTGGAATVSNDLYRYALPADRDIDPAAGSLTRISAGPAAEAVGSGTLASGSPTVAGVTTSSGAFAIGQRISANGIPAGTTVAAVGSGTLTLSSNASASGARTLQGSADPNTQEQTLRYLSDDGERAYFLTSAPIPGADVTPPKGGVTVPTGSDNQTATRNLYVFDGNATGSDRYKFIGALPFSGEGGLGVGPNGLNRCATSSLNVGDVFRGNSDGELGPEGYNCFRGTPSGDAVTFFTAGSLTGDDTDANTGDVYFYDIRSDELTRITAQPSSVLQQSYDCLTFTFGQTPVQCHGDPSQIGDGTKANASIAVVGTHSQARGWGGMRYTNLSQDANGVVSVYFESPLQFVPEDTNSGDPNCVNFGRSCNFWDVYQWREGEYSLISPGNSDDNSWYSGNSVDGRDVFIFTSARIDPREIEEQDFDIYDARIGGGFPYTPPATPCDVLAHQCRGAISTQQQPDAAIGSTATGASDNVAPTKKKATKKKTKKKKKAKKSKAKRSARNNGGSK